MSTIHVSNLPFSATEASVRALFAQHGPLDMVASIEDRDTGRARDIGCIEMLRGDAARTLQSLNGHGMEGRAIDVHQARQQPRGSGELRQR
jgi:RNA recognition motif-containing protein